MSKDLFFYDFFVNKESSRFDLREMLIKGTVSVISCDSPCKEKNARFTTIPFKPWIVYRPKRALCFNIFKITWILLKRTVCCEQFDKIDALLVYNLTLNILNKNGFQKFVGKNLFFVNSRNWIQTFLKLKTAWKQSESGITIFAWSVT